MPYFTALQNITEALASCTGQALISDSIRDQFYQAISFHRDPILIVLDDLGQQDVMKYIWALIGHAPAHSPPIVLIVTARPRLLSPITDTSLVSAKRLIEIKWSPTEAVQYLSHLLAPLGLASYQLMALAQVSSFNAKTLDFVVGQFRSQPSIPFASLLHNAIRPVESSIKMLPSDLDRERLYRLMLVKHDSQLSESLLLRSNLFWDIKSDGHDKRETLEQLASLHLICPIGCSIPV